MSPSALFAFNFIRPFFDENLKKYDDACSKNRDNARKRWEHVAEDATACDRMPEDATACDRIKNNAKNANTKQIQNKTKQNKTNEIVISENPADSPTLKNDRDLFFESLTQKNYSMLFGKFGNVPDEVIRREAYKFLMYWTETDMRGKPRWKKQPTFEPLRRFATWIYKTCEKIEESKPKRLIV